MRREARSRVFLALKASSRFEPYFYKVIARFEADVFPWIGQAPVVGITPPPLLEVLRRIESRGVFETADQRLAMLQKWAHDLDKLRLGADVAKLREPKA